MLCVKYHILLKYIIWSSFFVTHLEYWYISNQMKRSKWTSSLISLCVCVVCVCVVWCVVVSEDWAVVWNHYERPDQSLRQFAPPSSNSHFTVRYIKYLSFSWCFISWGLYILHQYKKVFPIGQMDGAALKLTPLVEISDPSLVVRLWNHRNTMVFLQFSLSQPRNYLYMFI